MRAGNWIVSLLALAIALLAIFYYPWDSDDVVERPAVPSPRNDPPVRPDSKISDPTRTLVPASKRVCRVVMSSDPGSRISNVSIRYVRHSPLSRGSVLSDERGVFRLPSPGVYSIVAEKEGFVRLFLRALRCGPAGEKQQIALDRGTRLELRLMSSDSDPAADVDVLILPGSIRPQTGWRRSSFYKEEGVLDLIERVLMAANTVSRDQGSSSSSSSDSKKPQIDRMLDRLMGRLQIGELWIPYLARGFERGRSDETGLILWQGIPADFRWGLLSSELAAQMNPEIEGEKSRAVPGGGIIPARRVPVNLSGIVEARSGRTVRLKAVVNLGNWVKARLVVPNGYVPVRRVMLLSRGVEGTGGSRMVRFVTEQVSDIDSEGRCVFHGVRPGHKVLKAWMVQKSVPAYRFYSRAFDYRGGTLDLGRVEADSNDGDAMLGFRVKGDPRLVKQIVAMDLSMLMNTSEKVGGGHYKIELRIRPGQLIRLDGQRGGRVYPELKPVLRKHADPITLKRKMFQVSALRAVHWIDVEVLSPNLTKVRVRYLPGPQVKGSSIGVSLITRGGGSVNGTARPRASWAEMLHKGSRPGLFAYAVQYGKGGQSLAAGVASFDGDTATVQLQRGGALTLVLDTNPLPSKTEAQWIRLVPQMLVQKRILTSPWVKQAKDGICRFEHIPIPGSYWVYVNDKKRKLIHFTRETQVDLR